MVQHAPCCGALATGDLDAARETYRRCASSEMQQRVETLQFPKCNALNTERVVHLSNWMAASLSSLPGVSSHCSRTQGPDSLGRGIGHLARGSQKIPQDVLRSRDVHLGKKGALQSPLVTSKRLQSINYCVNRAKECLVLTVTSTSATQSSTYRQLDFSILYREILQASGPTDIWRKGKEYAAAYSGNPTQKV